MIYIHNVDDFKDPLKQDLELEFCRLQNIKIQDCSSILTETYINHDEIHHIRSNWLGLIFFSPGDKSHIKALLALLHSGLDGVTKVGTDPKLRFVPFKVTTSNDRVLCNYVNSRHNTGEQLAMGRAFI